jgi:hypothetical protein
VVYGLLDVAALDLDCGSDLRFSLEYVQGDGERRREPLAVCAGGLFEEVAPVRSFHRAKGAVHFPGLWWSSTTSGHVGFESWLERDHVMLMDFDPKITGIASQPFWLLWQDRDGRPRRHAPDFFAAGRRERRGGGRAPGWPDSAEGRARAPVTPATPGRTVVTAETRMPIGRRTVRWPTVQR